MTYVINQPEKNWCQYTLDGVTYDIGPTVQVNGFESVVELTSEEKALEVAKKRKDWYSKSAERKLEYIKEIRLGKLKETDWMSGSDYTMPENIKTWRQSLRDIPQNNTTEEAYDLILARNENRELTHAIWSKP
tara:strand:- start:42 stop:440 length:399 start_codon:yes stop_codon:yes gene_type:complete